MLKKFSMVILCIALLLSFNACSKDETQQNSGDAIFATSSNENESNVDVKDDSEEISGATPDASSNENESNGDVKDNSEEISGATPDASSNENESNGDVKDNSEEISDATPDASSNEDESNGDVKDNSEEISNATEYTTVVFETDNVSRITFYAYSGNGKGSDVPAEHLDEIKTWLNSFKIDIDREVPEIIPPGTNTIFVEIEYSDGSIVKQGMDTTVINDVAYYICGDSSPECYDEIISKTSFN